MPYDAFISYSHAADDRLAPSLQGALQRFAKPWWRRRALRVFRDETSLSATPGLWSSIVDALNDSKFFVLLASPAAAQSDWVNREVAYWLDHHGPDGLLPVLTAGEWVWDDESGDFDWDGSDAVPHQLRKAFVEEPLFVDLRWAHQGEQLSLRHSRFRGQVAELAAAMRGIPKDELEGEDVRQHRRTLRLAWSAGATLVALLVVAVVAALFALGLKAQAQASERAALTSANSEKEQRRKAEEALEATRAARAAEEAAKEAAQRSAAEAEERRIAAVTAEKAEAQQRTRAERALQRAVEAQEAAQRSEAEAVAKARLAGSRQLSAQALRELGTDPNRALLLAVEAVRTERTTEARDSLIATMQDTHGLMATLQIPPKPGQTRLRSIEDVTASTDGRYVAGSVKEGLLTRDIVVWDMSASPPTSRVLPTSDLGGQSPTILFGASGRVALASAYVMNPVGSNDDSRLRYRVQLWNLETGQTLLPEPLISGGAYESPDRRHFVIPTDTAVMAIDSATGTPRWHQPGTLEPGGVIFAPNGHGVVGRTQAGRLVLWSLVGDTSVMAPEIPLGSPEDRLSSPSFDASGRFLAAVTGNNQVKVFDTSTGQAVGRALGDEEAITKAALSPDGQTVVAGGSRGTVRAFQVTTGAAAWPSSVRNVGAIDRLEFSPRGTSVLFSQDDTPGARERTGKITVLDTATGVERMSLGATRVVFAANERYGFTSTYIKDLKVFAVWDLYAGTPIFVDQAVGAIARTEDGRYVVFRPTTVGSTKVLVWDGNDPTLEPRVLSTSVYLAVAAQAHRLVEVSGDRRTVRLWDLNGRFEEQLLAPSSRRDKIRVAVSSNGALAATVNDDGTLRLTDLETGQTRPGPPLPTGMWLGRFTFTPGGDYLVAESLSRNRRSPTTLVVWRVRDGVEVGQLRGVASPFSLEDDELSGNGVSFSGNGKVVALRDGPFIRFHALHDLSRLGVEMNSRGFSRFALDHGGARLVTAAGKCEGGPRCPTSRGEVTVWDIATGAAIWEARLPSGSDWGPLWFDARQIRLRVGGVGYVLDATNGAEVRKGPAIIAESRTNADATLLVNTPAEFNVLRGSNDVTDIQLYDADTLRPIGRPLLRVGDFTQFFDRVFFSDDRRFVIMVWKGEVLRWSIDEGHLVERACTLAGRNLTGTEWKDLGVTKPYAATCPQWSLEH